MPALLAAGTNSYAQLITVLIIFVVVLGVTAWTTKWIAGYQKRQSESSNIELLEASRIGNNKYVQIVRVGETIYVLAIGKDTVTKLGEIPAEQLKNKPKQKESGFKSFFEKAMKRDSVNAETPKETDVHEDEII